MEEMGSAWIPSGADLLLLVPNLQLGNTTVQKLQLRYPASKGYPPEFGTDFPPALPKALDSNCP
jgi:hypothetical protein